MPGSGRACRRGTSCYFGSLGTIFYFAPSPNRSIPRDHCNAGAFLFQSLRCLPGQRWRWSRSAILRRRCSFHASLITPTEAFLAPPEAGEIAAAGGAAVGGGANAQKKPGPARRMVILLAPGGELLAIAAGAVCVLPRALRPRAGLPAMAATAATERINTGDAAEHLRSGSPMRHPRFTAPAFRARKLHSASLVPPVPNNYMTAPSQAAGTGPLRAAT